MTQKKSSSQSYNVVLEVLGVEHKASALTLEKALENLELDWTKVKGRGHLYVTFGKNEFSRLLNKSQLTRIAHNKIARGIWAKNLNVLLKSEKITNLPE